MSELDEIERARTGDQAELNRLVRRHRGPMLAHAYRMLGSVSEAEDAVQETFVRAWRALDKFEGRSSFRSWLYAIATRCCLDVLEAQKNRVLVAGAAADPKKPPAPPSSEVAWLEPIPDAILDADPESLYVRHERIGLAFLSALQLLPPRQRASLLLCDVLGFSAAEAGALLDSTVAAVNSALQRARAALSGRDDRSNESQTNDETTARLLERYMDAWRALDPSQLVALLREDAQLTMPPSPTWFDGRDDIIAFWRSIIDRFDRKMRLLPRRANGQPAFLVEVGGDGAWRPVALQVLELDESALIRRVHSFLDPKVIARFS